MRQAMKPLDGGHIPEPDKKWQRMSSVYGGEGFAEDLGLLQSSVAVVYALAIRRLMVDCISALSFSSGTETR